MAKILYGAPVREKIKEELVLRIANLSKRPVLAVIQVGDRSDSAIYIKNKKKFGEEIGVEVIIKNFSENFSESELLEEIKKINEDEGIDGVIVQLPLPEHLNAEKVVQTINPKKDADGLTTSEIKPEDSLLVTPATARAVEALLDFYDISVLGKKVCVIGRSKLAGGPIATMIEKKGGEVTVCHKETPNTEEICRNSDIIISAAGVPKLVSKEFVKPGQVIIDVGINRVPGIEIDKTKTVGDVAFPEVEGIVEMITPVPGGIGPLTVACLFENLLNLCYHNS